LGGGTEQFGDASEELHIDDDIPVLIREAFPCMVWSSALVDVNLEAKDKEIDFDGSVQEQIKGLITASGPSMVQIGNQC
jgi:hypothetical protein